ncbi:MAG: gamma-glutamyl-gamma-aminobutyrate hydrolase family protein [Burkholderiaceae bacterium]|nr:MAG: gamma-glutamyl-gamma-aminobutyrate hydrolase family protein [Burkholderiaceae bacterium]
MQTKRLRIGLSARLMHAPPTELGFRGKTLQYLEQSIAHWVMRRGALMFMLPTIEADGDLGRREISTKAYVNELDGLVLQGGADVSPMSYGAEVLKPEWAGDRVRDLYEIDLLWEFIAQGKPVLGVCRGLQLINVALGGTLYQDISTQRPDAHKHVDDGLYDLHRHDILINPDTWLAARYPDTERVRVSSIHHQAIDKLGSDLSVEAVGDDGIIECVRWKGAGFVVGVQWHPEFHTGGGDLMDSDPLLRGFLEEVEKVRDVKAAEAAAEMAPVKKNGKAKKD